MMSDPKETSAADAGTAYGSGVAKRLRSGPAAGPLAGANAAGEAGDRECGALVRIELRVADGRVEDAGFCAYGCPATLASAMEVVERVRGVPFLSAAGLSAHAVSDELRLLPSKEPSAELAIDALHAALSDAVAQGLRIGGSAHALDEDAILVGMSGGVDSAVAALLLKEQGFRTVGVTLELWRDPGARDDRSCCSPETVQKARRAAHLVGIPHLTIDARELFYSRVVEYFVDDYARGCTPNPCAKCNARLRFGLMLDVAAALGLSRIATGHYARLVGEPPGLARGVDRAKDQSYVLAEVAPEVLRRVVFPLGGMTKTEVRALAALRGLEGAVTPESQEICFVPDNDYRRFLRERLGDRPGLVVDGEGREVGRHLGTYNFTIGQRKGLGLGGGDLSYVVDLIPERSEVVVGCGPAASIGTVKIGGVVRHRRAVDGFVTVQLRSSGGTAAARAVDETTIELQEPIAGVAPGQTAVLAGTITATGAWAAREQSKSGVK
jgi:tRNA-specific 2-thiouridylase